MNNTESHHHTSWHEQLHNNPAAQSKARSETIVVAAAGVDEVSCFSLARAILSLPLSDVIRDRNSAHLRKRGRPPLRSTYSGGARRLRQIILPSFLSYLSQALSLSSVWSPYFPRFLRARERGRGFEAKYTACFQLRCRQAVHSRVAKFSTAAVGNSISHFNRNCNCCTKNNNKNYYDKPGSDGRPRSSLLRAPGWLCGFLRGLLRWFGLTTASFRPSFTWGGSSGRAVPIH